MTEQKPLNKTRSFFWIVLLTTFLVSLIELVTPVGVAEWILFIVPLVLCAFGEKPRLPFVVATLASLLLVAGYFAGIYFHGDPGEQVNFIAQVNRSLGFVVIWTVAWGTSLIVRSRSELRAREWVQTRLVSLGETIRGEKSLDRLVQDFSQYLASTLGAQMTAVYVYRGGEGYRLEGGLGLPPSSKERFSYRASEGLISRALQAGTPVMFSEIPADYFKVESALGQATPRHLALAPIPYNNDFNAVVELAFFDPLAEVQQDFLKKAASVLGIAIHTALNRERLIELLNETQAQAEELQTQQEELRVTNEELEEKARALSESQGRLETQQTELEQTNVQLEEQTRTLEEQKEVLEKSHVELEGLTSALKKASQYKSEFLANMSHELRTPLNSSLILAKLLMDNGGGNLNAEQVEFARTIYSAGNDLLTLINDILDLSKVEAGKLRITPQPIKTRRIADDLERAFAPVAQQKNLSFDVKIEHGAPVVFESDAQRIEQILRNFLSNAFKFTEKGRVRLSFFAVDRESPKPRLGMSVEDSGIGIAAENQEVIFEAFRQADGTTSRKFGGTGLGLTISRDLSRLLGGEIQVESEVGRGSKFTLVLPVEYKGAPAEAAQQSSLSGPIDESSTAGSTHGETRSPASKENAFLFEKATHGLDDDRASLVDSDRYLLVIEDDVQFAKILCRLAHEMRLKCVLATSSEEGMAWARRRLPLAILLDIGLPDHNGLVVLDRLKEDSKTRHIPVHVVSASDFRSQAFQMGAVGYTLKPVKYEQLKLELKSIEERYSRSLKRVLVVEDDTVQREAIAKLIGDQATEIVTVSTGGKALEQLRASTFDCVVMDLRLPDLSGFDVLETMGRDEQFSNPPVVVYTGRDLSPAEEERLRRYTDAIVVKGAHSPERLLNEVTLFLHRVEAELPRERQEMLRKLRNRERSFEGRTVMVVDDDVRNVFALTSVLEQKGAKVEVARNGLEAVQRLRARNEVDLVLMDIMMPVMDGYKAMAEIRSESRFKKLPIIALTAKAMADDRQRCLEAGANDYLPKPVDVEKLTSLVRVWIQRPL